MEKQSFQKAMEESEQEFRNQFDPTSENFHKGITQTVPLGGVRIPESMSSMYPEGFDPNQQFQIIDYGEQYKTIQENRNIMQNLKKTLAKLCPVVEAFLRHDQIFKQRGDCTNQKHIKSHEQSIAKEKINLVNVHQELKPFVSQMEAMGVEGVEMSHQLNQILNLSNKKYNSKETLTDFNFRVKKLSTKSFAEANKYLQKLKEIKKNYKKQKQISHESINKQKP